MNYSLRSRFLRQLSFLRFTGQNFVLDYLEMLVAVLKLVWKVLSS